MTGSFATGGEGGVAAGAVVDPLASQSSLVTAAGGRLLLVNAGSDSISLFSVTGTVSACARSSAPAATSP